MSINSINRILEKIDSNNTCAEEDYVSLENEPDNYPSLDFIKSVVGKKLFGIGNLAKKLNSTFEYAQNVVSHYTRQGAIVKAMEDRYIINSRPRNHYTESIYNTTTEGGLLLEKIQKFW